MTGVIVRYRVKPDRVEENAELVRAVYGELASTQPPGFRYATFLLQDGVTFVHVAFTEDGHDAPLPQLAAFKRFSGSIGERSEEAPQTERLTTRIGSFGL